MKANKQTPEYWDLWNLDGTYAGIMQRGDRMIPPDQYHVTVEIIPTDGKGYMLITKRSIQKANGGGLFEFPAGSVKAGEQPDAAALRELKEETGLDAEALQKITESFVPGMKRCIYIAVIPDLTSKQIALRKNETEGFLFVTMKKWHRIIGGGLFEQTRLKMYDQTVYEQMEAVVGLPQKEEQDAPQPRKRTVINSILITPEPIVNDEEQEGSYAEQQDHSISVSTAT